MSIPNDVQVRMLKLYGIKQKSADPSPSIDVCNLGLGCRYKAPSSGIMIVQLGIRHGFFPWLRAALLPASLITTSVSACPSFRVRSDPQDDKYLPSVLPLTYKAAGKVSVRMRIL